MAQLKSQVVLGGVAGVAYFIPGMKRFNKTEFVLSRAYRGLTSGFLLLRNFSIVIFCESTCLFYLSVNFYFMFLR